MIIYPVPLITRPAPRPPIPTAVVMLPAAPTPPAFELPSLIMAPLQAPGWPR